jgi:phosphate-selective porin OprO/OprP
VFDHIHRISGDFTVRHSPIHRLLALAVAATLPQIAMAEAPSEDRIKQLEQIVQQMQQQRAEQDKQLQALTQELTAVQQQMAQGKQDKIEEKGKAKGNPVYASLKEGIVFRRRYRQLESSIQWSRASRLPLVQS